MRKQRMEHSSGEDFKDFVSIKEIRYLNILVSLNDNYFIPLRIMLESLFQHEETPIRLFLLYTDLTEKHVQDICSILKSQGGLFYPVFISEDFFQDAPVFHYTSRETYYRFLCSILLPDTIERVLYLDPDILIRGSILPLYRMKFQKNLVIGVADHTINQIFIDHKRKIGLSDEKIYFNAGVLLFNLNKMRKDFDLKAFVGLLEKYQDAFSFLDQDMLNLYFYGKIGQAGSKFNFNSGFASIRELFSFLFGGENKQEDPVIVHYMGELKPWQPVYYGRFFGEYFTYLKKYLNWKGKILFFFRPFYVAARVGASLVRKVFHMQRSK